LVNPAQLPVALSGWDLTSVNPFKNYQITRDAGVLTPLTATDLGPQDITFYVNEVDGSNDTAKYTAIVGGIPKVRKTSFVVSRPASLLQVTSIGTSGINSIETFLQLNKPVGGNGGINFSGSVSLPANWNAGNPGHWMFMQLGAVNRKRWVGPNNQLKVWDVNDLWGLDSAKDGPAGSPSYSPIPNTPTADPQVPLAERGEGGNSDYWNTGAAAHITEDTPKAQIVSDAGPPTANTIQVADAYRMHIMFLPPGAHSVWVPLTGIDWWWGGTAESFNPVPTAPTIWNGRVKAGTTPYSDWTYPNDSSDIYDAPIWTKNLNDHTWVNG
jgi:hypothetical protein